MRNFICWLLKSSRIYSYKIHTQNELKKKTFEKRKESLRGLKSKVGLRFMNNKYDAPLFRFPAGRM